MSRAFALPLRRHLVIPAALLSALAALLLTPAARAADPTPQDRPFGKRVSVAPEQVKVDDGDTVVIDWRNGDVETIRILGIDTPETQHIEHNIPFDQPFGREAMGFAEGAFAAATQIELLRSPTKDPYGRTLGYLFLNGRNYSELVILAGLAVETVSHYGDNGCPDEAKAVTAAAAKAGPVAFEAPYEYRNRMRKYADAAKSGDHAEEKGKQ
ncbi:MAG: thermonuclease family protein [Candidatus Eisenbacteria bacterium]